MLKKLFSLFLVLTFIFTLTSCKKEEIKEETTNQETTETTPEITTPEAHETTPETSTPEETTPEVETQYTLKDAYDLCKEYKSSYKENFDANKVIKVSGKVICDYAISGNYHYILLASNETILPLLINANKDTIKKYHIGKSYEVMGNPGSYRNSPVLKALIKLEPKEVSDVNFNLDSVSSPLTINELYNESYKLEVVENNNNLGIAIYKVRATYVDKITDGIFMIFDGEKHILVHEKNLSPNFIKGDIHDFYLMPSVSQGKKACEYLGASKTDLKDPDVLNKIKALATTMDIDKLSQTNRYNDNKTLFPHIFKVTAFVQAFVIDDYKYHLCFTSSLEIDPKYASNNERPMAIYLKNHYLVGRDVNYSNLVPYYLNELSGEFYLVITNYNSERHAFEGFVFNDLTIDLEA